MIVHTLSWERITHVCEPPILNLKTKLQCFTMNTLEEDKEVGSVMFSRLTPGVRFEYRHPGVCGRRVGRGDDEDAVFAGEKLVGCIRDDSLDRSLKETGVKISLILSFHRILERKGGHELGLTAYYSELPVFVLNEVWMLLFERFKIPLKISGEIKQIFLDLPLLESNTVRIGQCGIDVRNGIPSFCTCNEGPWTRIGIGRNLHREL